MTEKNISIAIAGHVDHGKTTLVRSLTGVDTDRLTEEKRRGFSIECGVAALDLPSGERVALVDVPGQTRFLKNTIRGLSCVDMAILVVAADDGVMPQTLDHLDILNLLKVRSGFVVLSKADLVDEETLELAGMEIQEMVKGTFLEEKPIVPFSAVNRRGIADIVRHIALEGEDLGGRPCDAPFRLWIDQLRGLPGFGTVVTGTILSGSVSQDDRLCLLPSGKETRARFLEVHHHRVPKAAAGQRVGINLPRVTVKEVGRGMLLCKPGAFAATSLLNGEIRVRSRAAGPLRNRQRVKLHLGTSITNTMVVLMERERLEPGESGLAQLRLAAPVAALPTDPFVVSLLNVHSVIAGGTVLEIPLEKYRRARAAATIPYLKAIQNGNLKSVMDRFFSDHVRNPVCAPDIARRTGFAVQEIGAEIHRRVMSGEMLSFEGRGFMGKGRYQALKEELVKVVEKVLSGNPFQRAVIPDEIRSRLPHGSDKAMVQGMLTELCQEGRLNHADGAYQIPNVSARLSQEQERTVRLLLQYGRELGLVPFCADMFWKFHNKKFNKNEILRLLDFLCAQDRLIRLRNDRFLTPEALEQIKEGVRRIIRNKGRLTLADMKEIVGYGRTVGVPVLDYLDAIGFTRREGNERVLVG